MTAAESFTPQNSERSFFICAAVSILLHTGFVAGLSLLDHTDRKQEEVPIVQVRLEPVTQQEQQDAPPPPSPSMRSTPRPISSSPLTPTTPMSAQNLQPLSKAPSVQPLTTQIEEKRPSIPFKKRVLKDHRAANALLGKSLMKMAESTSTPHQSTQTSQPVPSPTHNLRKRTTSVSPLSQPNQSEPESESNILARLPQRKMLVAPFPGGQEILGSKVGLLHSIPPMYPRVARESGWEGTVTVRVLVGINGTPKQIQVRKSSGYTILDEAAVEAVREWRFKPAKDGNIPINTFVDIPVNFDLHNR